MKNGSTKRLFASYCVVSLLTIILGLAGQLTGPAVSGADAAEVVPVGPAYGAEYGEWSARWWQWAISIPVATNPILSDGNVDCTLGQTGNVWFLAGNFGGVSVRTCTIENKPLFFPVFNFVAFDPFPNETILDLRKQVEAPIDAATGLSVEIDGAAAPNPFDFRVQSPVFQVVIPPQQPPGQSFLIGRGVHPTMVTDGYWMLVKPLGAGTHTVRIEATAPGFSLDVTYNLTVTE